MYFKKTLRTNFFDSCLIHLTTFSKIFNLKFKHHVNDNSTTFDCGNCVSIFFFFYLNIDSLKIILSERIEIYKISIAFILRLCFYSRNFLKCLSLTN